MICLPAKPKYNINDIVNYVDAHGRHTSGRVRSVEAKWVNYGRAADTLMPHLVYRVTHPTYYRNQAYVGESSITDMVSGVMNTDAQAQTWHRVESQLPDEGAEVICRFPAHFGGFVYYIAKYYGATGFIHVSGNYAKPEEWAEIPK